MAIATIRRNSKRLPEVFRQARDVKVYSLDNYFVGRTLSGDPRGFLAKQLEQYRFARLYEYDHTYCLHIHGNLWYEWGKGE